MERLSKYLARLSVYSRRKAERIILEGRVKVNGGVIQEPQHKVVAGVDTITLDNRVIDPHIDYIYIALYKPVGYISDLADVRDRQLARDLIDLEAKLFPVGRLDYNSEGLIVFTNDGDLAYRITHPKHGVEKEYLVKFKGTLTNNEMQKLRRGVTVEGETYRVASIKYARSSIKNAWYSIIIDEGKNRMIRKMGGAINHPVLRLKRIRIGTLKLGDLRPGEYRFLGKEELPGTGLENK